MAIRVEVDREIAKHLLPLVRGLKLSTDLDLAESAIRAERELTDKLYRDGKGTKQRRRLEPA